MDGQVGADLYLELSPLSPETYAERRVDAVLSVDRVERATWWRNLCPDRTDLPRVLDEFSTLGMFETGAGFVAPAVPDGVVALHFRRTPRPGQGRLTGKPTLGLSLVLIAPRSPADAQALRDWGDFVHISNIAAVAVPGYTMITPYENVFGNATVEGQPRYLHLYEMDTDDAEASFQAMTPLVAQRLGGRDTAAFREWAWHDALRIVYVNSFRREGERARR